MGIRYLSRADVIEAAGRVDPVDAVRAALDLHAKGRTTLPDEAYLPWHTDEGTFARSLSLPAAVWADEPAIGVKIINSSLANPDRGLPRAHGLTMVFDRETAVPVAIMEGAYLSALRTSACSALSIELLGPSRPGTVAVIGCGTLGEGHVRLLHRLSPATRYVLHDTSPGRAAELAARLTADGIPCATVESAEQAVRSAEVVITTTTTTTGYVPFDWLAPGTLVVHVSLDDVRPDVVERSDLVVIDDWQLVSTDDRRLLGRLYRSGDLLGPEGEAFDVPEPHARRVDATLADLIAGRHPGRSTPEQVILCNPFGMGILDVALAAEVLREAVGRDLGIVLPT